MFCMLAGFVDGNSRTVILAREGLVSSELETTLKQRGSTLGSSQTVSMRDRLWRRRARAFWSCINECVVTHNL